MIVRLEGDEYVVYDAKGQEVGRYPSLAEAREEFPLAAAPPLGWEPGQPLPAAGGEGVGMAEEEEVALYPELTDAEVDYLTEWNDAREGLPACSETGARRAKIYMEAFGLTFEEALNLHAHWRNNEPGIPAPHEVRAALELQERGELDEIGRRLRQIGAEPPAWHRQLGPQPPELGVAAGPAPTTEQAALARGQAIAGVDPAIVTLVREFAQSSGVPFEILMGIVLAESGGDPMVPGDNGHSIGLLQLHDEGQGAGMTVEERQDPRRNLEVGIGPIAQAYREGIELGYTGDDLIYYIASHSGHPTNEWSEDSDAQAGYANILRNVRMMQGETAEVPAVGAPDMRAVAQAPPGVGGAGPVDFEALIYNSDLPRPFTGVELTAGAAQFPNLNGVPLIDAMLAASGRPLTDQEAAAIIAARQMAIEMRGKIEDWDDADRDFVWREGMTLEDVVATVRAGQKPQEWWKGKMEEAKEYLARFGLTMDDAVVMQEYGIPIQEYLVMRDVGMTPQEWVRTSSTFGGPLTPDQIFAAANLGYDPAAMGPEQIASVMLQTDLAAQVLRLTGQIPEGIRPDIAPGAFVEAYYVAQQEARMRGEYLSPEEFLRGEYPGLFGGGTAREVRVDLERIGAWRESDMPFQHRLAGQTGMLGLTYPQGIAGPMRHMRPGERRAAEQRFARLREGERTPAEEMYTQRAMAGAFVDMPVEQRYKATWASMTEEERQAAREQQERIRQRYPELAERTEAGEFEDEEEKRRRRMKETLEGGRSRMRRAGGAGGASPFQPGSRFRRAR